MNGLDLSGREPALPEPLTRLLTDAVCRQLSADDVWRTPWLPGDPTARTAFGRLLGVDPDTLAVTGGVRAACVSLAALVREAVVERPTFGDIPAILATAGVRVESRSWAEMPTLPPSRHRRLWWITSPGRNPDGSTATALLCQFLADRAGAGDLVVRNSTYRWFGTQQPIAGEIEVGSLSKIVGGGIRTGWLISPDPVRPEILARNSFGPPTAWQRAWAEVVGTPGFRGHVADLAAETGHAVRAYLRAATPGAAPTVPNPVGPHLLLRAPNGLDEKAVLDRCGEHGLRLSPGSAFGVPSAAARLSLLGVDEPTARRVALTLSRLWR